MGKSSRYKALELASLVVSLRGACDLLKKVYFSYKHSTSKPLACFELLEDYGQLKKIEPAVLSKEYGLQIGLLEQQCKMIVDSLEELLENYIVSSSKISNYGKPYFKVPSKSIITHQDVMNSLSFYNENNVENSAFLWCIQGISEDYHKNNDQV